MTWARPVSRNNWGHIEVFLGQYAMTPFGTMASDAGVPKLLPGPHRVRWIDRTEEDVDIHLKTKRFTVGDHGHDSVVISEVPALWINYRGVKIELEVMEAGCDIWVGV